MLSRKTFRLSPVSMHRERRGAGKFPAPALLIVITAIVFFLLILIGLTALERLILG